MKRAVAALSLALAGMATPALATSEGDERVAGGVFTFKGEGAFVVDCSEPE